MSQEQTQTQNDQRDWEQEFENFGNDAVSRVKDLVEEGNVRRLVMRKANGAVLFEVPLTPAIVVGVVMTLWMPYLTILAVVGAFIAKLKVDIVHVETVEKHTENVDITS